MNFYCNAPNSHVPANNLLEFLHMLFQQQPIIPDLESVKYACKSHTVSAENFLVWLTIKIQLKYNNNLKIYNAKVD